MSRCKVCSNELENEDEEMDDLCDDCREEYHPKRILHGY